MTEEELQKEVEEYISSTPTEGAKDFVVYKVKVGKNAFAYVVEHKNELCFSDWIKMYEGTERECYKVVGYLDSAEPREKRIAELETRCNELFLQTMQLTKAKELLKEFVHHYKNKTIYIENMQDLLEQVEQFIKDSEVEK